MEQGIKDTLGSLYAIRATMSLVAENDDSATPEREEVNRNRGLIAHSDFQLSTDRRNLENKLVDLQYDSEIVKANAKLRKLQSDQATVEKTCNDKAKLLEKYKMDAKFSLRNFFDCVPGKVWGIYIGVYLGVLALSLLFFFMMLNLPNRKLALLLSYLPPLGYIVIAHLITFFVVQSKEIKAYRGLENKYNQVKEELNQIKEEIKQTEQQIQEYQNRIDNGEKYLPDEQVQTLQEELSQRQQSHDEECSAITKTIEGHQAAIQAIALRSQAIIDGAVKAYPIIDLRDWENVDLLIYYFETGRADNIKEALQLVDRQRQTDQIVRELAMASNEISRTIHQSMVRLGDALAQSFNLLSYQFADQHEELMHSLEAQTEKIVAQSGAQTTALTNAQVSSQAMNEALLQKISTSSGKLAEQMDRQMKEVYHIY